jgi:hypothetical protein
MKKILLTLAAVGTLAAGASAAQAKVNIDLYFGGYGGHHGHHGYYNNYYEPVGYYQTRCHKVNVKHVKWVYGEKVVFWKTRKVCNKVYYGD